tara:strand:- start:1592 stop:4651 length:3060 start_codon:yes stop_codon:yes gene_type:complete
MTTRYDILIEANDKASKNIKAINIALKKTDKNATKAAKAVGKMGGNLAKMSLKAATGGMKGLAAATVAASAAFVVFGTKSLNALDELGKLSTKLGVGTKFLSEYAAVADKAGLSQTQFSTGVQRFLRRLGEAQQGTGELLKPLRALGIGLKDSNGNFREGTEVFKEYIASLGEMENAQQRLAFATKGFDTEGVAFINIAKLGTAQINKFKQAAREAGLVVDDKLIRAAEDAKDAISGITDIARGFGLQFFGNLAKPLQTFADNLKDKINEAVKGAGGMEQFSKQLAGSFLGAVADTLEAFGELFNGFANTMRILGNVAKIMLSKIPAKLMGGVNYAILDDDAKSVKELQKELEAAIKLKDKLQSDRDAMPWYKKLLPQQMPLPGYSGLGAAEMQPITELAEAAILVNDLKKEIAELENITPLHLDLIPSDLLAEGGTLDTGIKKLRDWKKEMQAPIASSGGQTMQDYLDDSQTVKAVNTQINNLERLKAAHREYAYSRMDGDRMVADEQDRVTSLIGSNTSRLFKSQKQATIEAKTYQLEVDKINKILSDGISLTADQRYQLEAIRASYYEAGRALVYYGEHADLVTRTTRDTATALQKNRDEYDLLTKLLDEYTGKLRLNGQDTDTNKAIVNSLTVELEKNKNAYNTLLGILDKTKKPLETTSEFMTRIKEQASMAANSTLNMARASAILTANLLAGRGDLEAQAAQLKLINEMMNDGNSGELTPMQAAVERLKNMREEARLNPIILEQLKQKYKLTADEAEALGLVKEASLTATETLFKGMDENLKKFNELEATLNNADAIENLAEKYGTSTANIIAFLKDAQNNIQIFKDETTTIAGIISDTWDQMGKNMAAGIAQGIMKGEGLFNSFSGFLKNFANQVITQIIQKMLVQPMINQMAQFGGSLMGGLGGGVGGMSGGGMGFAGIISKLFTGGFAEGGNIPGGKFGLVGENGPEFINGPARITPMNNDINSSEGLTVNFNINAISTSDGTSFILEHKKEITGVIQNAYNKRGKVGIY